MKCLVKRGGSAWEDRALEVASSVLIGQRTGGTMMHAGDLVYELPPREFDSLVVECPGMVGVINEMMYRRPQSMRCEHAYFKVIGDSKLATFVKVARS